MSTPSIEAFAQELMGKACPVALLQGKGKGALGEWVEREMRMTEEGQRCQWAGRSEAKADCQGLEIKVVVRHARKGKHAFRYRLKEDLALGMIGPSLFQTTYLESKLYDKLNLLLVVVELVGDAYLIQGMKQVNLQEWNVVQQDFERSREHYQLLCQTLEPSWAIDGLGHQTPGYGVALKSKTKGHSKKVGQARTRAFYVRKAFVEHLLMNALL